MLNNCKNCGRVVLDGNLCPKCSTEHQVQLKVLKEYLTKNPRATLFDITADLDINTRMVLDLVKRGEVSLQRERYCETCGKSISSGTFCEDCR